MTAQSGTAGTVVSLVPRAVGEDAEMWFLSRRTIGAAALGKMPVASGTVFFPDLKKKAPAVFFKYPQGWKARAYPEKAHVSGGAFKAAFWNIEAVLNGPLDTVYITEGELDALSLVDAEIPADCVLSVPCGAREKSNGGETGYDYVREALAAGLSRVRRFVWCGDDDGPGHALRADMARILGAARFHFVTWPEGCKDANDYLCSDGAENLRELVTLGAREWPVDGIYRIDDLPEPPDLTIWDTGFPEWESKIKLAQRTLSVVTGHPGHGKTMLWAQIWFQVARRYDFPIAVASFETRPKPHLRRQLRTLFTRKLERDLTPEEIAQADSWIREHYLFIQHADQRPTLEWILDMAEVAVVRHGAKVIQVDPWNRLEDQKGRDETKTEYIGRCLKTIHAFAHDMGVHFQVLAHPAKMDHMRRNTPPMLEDISDSKNWDNMVDQGFVVHRPRVFDPDTKQRMTEAKLYHRKARFEELGWACEVDLNFDLLSGRYVSADYGGKYA